MHVFLGGYNNLDLLFSQRVARNLCVGTKGERTDMRVGSQICMLCREQ